MNLNELKEKIKKYKIPIIMNVMILVIAFVMISAFHLCFNDGYGRYINETYTTQYITNIDEKPVLQMIFGSGCIHCQKANIEIFGNLSYFSKEYTVNMVSVDNIDPTKLRIVGVPTFIVYKNNVEVKRVIGFENITVLKEELE